MDKKLKENSIRLVIFCSPHNPTGRVWEKWEIEKAMEIFRENDCIVISDEILNAGWDVGVAYQDGRKFNDDFSIRMNLALPFPRVAEAFDRMKKYVFV